MPYYEDQYDGGGPNWGCIIPTILILGACAVGIYHSATDPEQIALRKAQAEREQQLETTGVIERVMPDGTALYHSKVNGEDVYFSRAGASWETTESCGKHCTHTIKHNTGNAE